MKKDEERIISIEKAIADLSVARLDKHEAWERMREATKKGKKLCMIWKIPNSEYQAWYNRMVENCKKHDIPVLTTIEDETTYIVHSGAKAFDGNMGGYSIFAVSLGMLKRGEIGCDRIERSGFEWAFEYGTGEDL